MQEEESELWEQLGATYFESVNGLDQMAAFYLVT